MFGWFKRKKKPVCAPGSVVRPPATVGAAMRYEADKARYHPKPKAEPVRPLREEKRREEHKSTDSSSVVVFDSPSWTSTFDSSAKGTSDFSYSGGGGDFGGGGASGSWD